MGPDNKELKAKDTEINSAGTGVTCLKSCFRWIQARHDKCKNQCWYRLGERGTFRKNKN